MPRRAAETALRLRAPRRRPDMHTPLMLQIVLGLDAAPSHARSSIRRPMGQRLSPRENQDPRGWHRFRDSRSRITARHRLEAVLDAIYAAYGSGWDDVAGTDRVEAWVWPRKRCGWFARAARCCPKAGSAGVLGPDAPLRGAPSRPARRERGIRADFGTRFARVVRAMIDEAERELTAAAAQNRARPLPARSRAAVGACRRRSTRPRRVGRDRGPV